MNTTPGSARWAPLASLTALAVAAAPVMAQLQSASAAGLGTANNYTARARGFAALGLNPAALGLASSPGFSLAVLPIRIRAGVEPVTLGDLKDFEGRVIPDATKDEWLRRISASGGERALAGARVTGLSLTVGHFGFQVSAIGYGHADLAEPVAELLLYGNAGRTGSPGDFTLTSSSLDAWAVTTVGATFALPLSARMGPYEHQSFAVGATLKYSVGNVLMMGRERGGVVTSDPLEVNVQFPLIQTDTAGERFNNGTGVGLDVGAAWEGGPWSLGFAVRNLFSTFEWDRGKLFFRPGQALFNESTRETNLEAVPASGAPEAAALLSEVAKQKFNPIVVVSATRDLSPILTVMGELRNRIGDGLDVGPKFHMGAGAEVRPLPFLHARAGLAKITDGFQMAAGASLILGPADLSGAYLKQTGRVGEASFGQLTLSFGGR